MMDPLLRALDRCAARGRQVRLWVRDDDAVAPGEALDRLFSVAGPHVPVTLAVIPAFTGPALAERLQRAPGVAVTLHGWAHRNHAPGGEKSQELGPHRPPEVVLDELARGARHLAGLHGARFLPILVPPWNRIAPAVVAGLPGLGIRALSVFGAERAAPLPVINTHVDVIDWRGTRGARPKSDLLADIVARIETGGAVGLLTHHLVHDEAVWSFLSRLFSATRDHPGCRWVALSDLLPPS